MPHAGVGQTAPSAYSKYSANADYRLIVRALRVGVAQPHTGSSAVLINELDARRLQGAADGGIIGGCHRGFALRELGPPHGGDPDRRILRQILGTPAQKRPRGADLRASQRGMGAIFHVDAHDII